MTISPARIRFIFTLSALAGLALLLACAEIVAPPGGPVDKTPPKLVSSIPENGATEVPRDDKIVIVFSEGLLKPTAGRIIFVAPRPEQEPKVRFKNDRIEVQLPDSFQVDQTYLVSIASTVTDHRNNRLDSTITIAFSTGATLDSGSVSGTVSAGGTGQGNALVGLYDRSRMGDPIQWDSLYPDYQTATNREGYFSFGYLPPRDYYLVAYVDQNKDERLNPNREMFALPDRPIIINDSIVSYSGLYLPLTETDTLSPEIMAASVNTDNLLQVRLTKKIPTRSLRNHPSDAVLRNRADTTGVIYATALAETADEKSDVLFFCFDTIPSADYRLEVTYNTDQPTLVTDSLALTWREDKKPPSLASYTPEDKLVFLDAAELSLTFSEPLDTLRLTDQSFTLYEDETTLMALTRNWISPFRLDLTTQYLPGASYRLDIAEFDIVDRAGNPMGDSLQSIDFRVLDNDSLGSVAGEIVIVSPDKIADNVVLFFDAIGRRQRIEHKPTSRRFTVELPAGKYKLSGFIDSDLDGLPGEGSLFPFTPSETRAEYPDTISVRARFETAGIEMRFE